MRGSHSQSSHPGRSVAEIRDLSPSLRARAAGDASDPRRWSIPFAQPSHYSSSLHGTGLPFAHKTRTLTNVQTGTCPQAMSPAGRNAYGRCSGPSATKRAVSRPNCNRHVAKYTDLASPRVLPVSCSAGENERAGRIQGARSRHIPCDTSMQRNAECGSRSRLQPR